MILAAWGMLASCLLGLVCMADAEPFSWKFWRVIGYVGGMTVALIAIIDGWN